MPPLIMLIIHKAQRVFRSPRFASYFHHSTLPRLQIASKRISEPTKNTEKCTEYPILIGQTFCDAHYHGKCFAQN